MPALRIVASNSLEALEDHLFERLAALLEQYPLGPVAIVVPTGRLRAYLERSLLLRRLAVAGVEFLHHHALAERILAGVEDGPAWDSVTPLLLEQLAQQAAAGGQGALSRYLAQRPEAIHAVLASLRDLRDAGVDAVELRAAGESAFAELHERIDRELERLAAGQGAHAGPPLLDGAALSRRAAAACGQSTYVRRLRQLFHYGAYDLTGAHRDLIVALSQQLEAELLAPLGPAPQVQHARARLERLFAGSTIQTLSAVPSSVFGARLARLFDETATEARPATEAGSDTAVEVFSAQGAEAELSEVCRRILELVGRGQAPPLRQLRGGASSAVPTQLPGIGIVARSLEPYAPYVDRVLAVHGLGYSTSVRDPLLRHPQAQAFLLLIRVLAEDFPRQATVELLRSGVFLALRNNAFEPDRWDRWSRWARIAGGRESWTGYLPRRLEERFARYREGRGEAPNAEQIEASRRSVGGLCAIIDALAADAERWPEQRTWSDHVEFLREVAERWLKGFGRELDHPAIAAILSVLTDLGQLDALQRKAPNPRVVLETLERRLESAALPLGRRVGEGVQVLDMMQARGLRFDHLFLIGLNSDLWPRRARRDPFLPEEVRRRLATRPGCSLSPKLDGAEEERLLLAMTLDSARRSLTVSYQRADPLGSAKVPALAFRELARLLHGDPDPALVLPSGDQRERVPAHPSQLWRRSSRASGLRASRAAAAAALLLPRKLSAAAASDLAPPRQRQTLAAGLTLLEAIERWRDEELAYDAVLPPGLLAPRRPFSPTRLQTYGRCPLQYFLIEGLRVKELEDPEDEELLPVVELGRAAHELLEQVYRDLMPLLGTSERPLDWEAASRRADQLLDQHWESAFGAIGRRLSDKLPLLWNRTLSHWRQALHAGIRDDLREMAEERWRPLQLEVELQGNFGAELHGFVDRLDVGPRGRLRVVDYKTSGNLERRVDPKLILLGEQVQLPAYIEMARSAHHTEVIGLLLPIGPEIDRQQRQDFKFENDALRQGLRETLELFDREIELGHFPLQKGTHCNWCAYLGGCRRNHPPTVERSATARAFATWRRLRSKTPENPLLRHT